MARTVSAYIAAQPRARQGVLRRVRAVIRKALPGAVEVISYGIPAYTLSGSVVLYFAGWTKHYSLYPAGPRLAAAFKDKIAPFRFGKTLRFPLSEPVPARLIGEIARFRAKEARAKAKRG